MRDYRDIRECEAILILRDIVEGPDERLPEAIAKGRRLLRAMRTPRVGGPCRISNAQLCEIARRRATGETEQAIAAAVGLSRDTVHYHLTPSQAMQEALATQRA